MEKRKTPSKSIKKKHSGGRPTKYKIAYVEQVYVLTSKGFTDKELSEFFKVRERTINRWKDKYPDFCQSQKRGKDDYDSNVIEKSLAKRAAGYQYIETTKTITGKAKKITIKEVTKEVAPDPTSMIFWLKNRRPERWRDKHSYEHGLTPEVLRAILSGLPKDFADGVRKELRILIEKRNNKI
jgi:hypothetical protein